jgi:4-amino-4-deoxy-L-arabinose transferase-like glycosyltransferase
METSFPRWQSAALFVLAVLTVFLFLGSRGLNEPDEGRYAEIGREMALSGDWLVPTLNGVEHFQKPPMVYWATALSFKAFGFNNTAARLPSALAALGTLGLTFWMGWRLFNARTGLAAAWILLCSLQFFFGARLLTPDMTMGFWITAAIAALVNVDRSRRLGNPSASGIWSWLFFIAMGLGFLTKGPMAFVVPISAAVCWQWGLRKEGAPVRLPWFRGLLLMLVVGLSWFIAVALKNPGLLDYFVGDELVKRFASSKHGRSKAFYFFFWVLPIGLTPWLFFFGALLWDALCKLRRKVWPSSEQALLLGWILIPFLVLSMSGSKLPTYLLPLFPGLALAISAWTRNDPPRQLWTGAFFATLGLLALLAIGIPVAGRFTPAPLPSTLWMVPGLGAALYLFLRDNRAAAQVALGLAAATLWLASIQRAPLANPWLAQQASVEPLALKVRAAGDFGKATVFACEVRAHGWEFYLQKLTYLTRPDMDVVLPLSADQQTRVISNLKECERLMLERAPAYGLVRRKRFDKTFTASRWVVLGDSGDFLLIGTPDTALAAGVKTTE